VSRPPAHKARQLQFCGSFFCGGCPCMCVHDRLPVYMCSWSWSRVRGQAYDTTEWDELQQKHGNLEGVETGRDRLRAVEAAERQALEELEEEQASQADRKWEAKALQGDLDDVDDDDERFMLQYRERRMAEMRREAKRAKFGDVLDISADSFRQEVTDAADDDLRVVVHLYSDNTPECQIVDKLLLLLAKKHPHTKFSRIFFLNAIPNYPPDNLPTILVYHKHDIALSIVTLRQLGGLQALSGINGERIMSAALSTCGAVPPVDEKDVVRAKAAAGDASDSDSGSD